MRQELTYFIPESPLGFLIKPESRELLHYVLRWRENNSPRDLGIIRFGFEMFPNSLDKAYGVPNWLRPALYDVLSFEEGWKKIDRAYSEVTYREGSKTTWFSKILPIYMHLVGKYGIYNNGVLLPRSNFTMIRGNNATAAEKKLNNIFYEFGNNKRIIKLFGDLRPTLKQKRERKLKDNAQLLTTTDGQFYVALGINTPARGENLFDMRPTLGINDDVQNRDNTKTADGRNEVNQEILGEQMGGLTDDGMIINLGNFVHPKCFIAETLKPNSGWKTRRATITYRDANGIEVADWEKRYTVEYVKRLEKWWKNNPAEGGLKRFRMEYYNEIISEKVGDFKVTSFRYFRERGRNYVMANGKVHRAMIVVAVDPGISKTSEASPAIAVVAYCSDGKRRILKIIKDKYDINDRYEREEDRPSILATTIEQLAKVTTKGLCEEAVRIILEFKAEGFVIENRGQQLAWFNNVDDLLNRLNYGNVIKGIYKPTLDKRLRIEMSLLPYISVGMYEIDENCVGRHLLEDEMRNFDSSTLDIMDAILSSQEIGYTPEEDAQITGEDYSSLSVDKEYMAYIERKEKNAMSNTDVEEWIIY
jgi:hypothetical protein